MAATRVPFHLDLQPMGFGSRRPKHESLTPTVKVWRLPAAWSPLLMGLTSSAQNDVAKRAPRQFFTLRGHTEQDCPPTT